MPVLIFVAFVLTLTKEYFFLAAFGLTAFVILGMMYIIPCLFHRCESKFSELPEDQKLLKKQL